MKKCLFLLLITALLTGCAAQDTFETVSDEQILPVMAEPRHVAVSLPGETALPVMENDNGRVYITNDYEIMIQTLEAGDLQKTMEIMSGHSMEELTVMETFCDDVSRYEFVWASAGEGGDLTGRGVILDDNRYHYCMSVLRTVEPDENNQTNWEQVFSSFRLV
jgi:hypothetical protein